MLTRVTLSAILFYIYIYGTVSSHLSQTNFRGVLSVILVIPCLSRQSPAYAVLDVLALIFLENVHIVIVRLMGNVHDSIPRAEHDEVSS